MLRDLRDLFADTVVREPYVSTDRYGAVTYGAAQTWRCRVSNAHRLVRAADGREVVSTVQVLIAGTPGCTVRDRYTLPARFTPQQPPALAVKLVSDERGPLYEVVLFA
jgi:Txe/YoeB family toxin of Txe-Axe toxin-antitoxin module